MPAIDLNEMSDKLRLAITKESEQRDPQWIHIGGEDWPIDEAIRSLRDKGYTVIKLHTFEQRERLKAFIENELLIEYNAYINITLNL